MGTPIIGTIGDAMRLMKLGAKWQMRKIDPRAAQREQENPQIAALRRSAEGVKKSNIISSIGGKLKAGAELTDEELQYLKENMPSLYQEAMEIKHEREAYKKQLEACKTKEDVERLRMQKSQEFLSVAKTISANPYIPKGEKLKLMEKLLCHAMGIQNEHMKFVQSGAYASLPEEQDEEEKEEKKTLPVEETDAPREEPPVQEGTGEPGAPERADKSAASQEHVREGQPADKSAASQESPQRGQPVDPPAAKGQGSQRERAPKGTRKWRV